jgi:hypothetical protein
MRDRGGKTGSMLRYPCAVANPTLIKAVVACAVVALLAAGGWWGYRAVKRTEMQTAALQLVQDATAQLNEALGLITAGSEIRPRLEREFAEVEKIVRQIQSLDASLNPPLVRAGDAYITDVQAFLRRQIDSHRARDALLMDMGELTAHIRSGGDRSAGWITRALELKQRMEKNFFDYRFATGGLDKSFAALRETRKGFDPLEMRASVVAEALLSEAQQRIQEASAALAKDVEEARKLPVGR